MDPVWERAVGPHLLEVSVHNRAGLQGRQRVRIQRFVLQLCGQNYKFYEKLFVAHNSFLLDGT